MSSLLYMNKKRWRKHPQLLESNREGETHTCARTYVCVCLNCFVLRQQGILVNLEKGGGEMRGCRAIEASGLFALTCFNLRLETKSKLVSTSGGGHPISRVLISVTHPYPGGYERHQEDFCVCHTCTKKASLKFMACMLHTYHAYGYIEIDGFIANLSCFGDEITFFLSVFVCLSLEWKLFGALPSSTFVFDYTTACALRENWTWGWRPKNAIILLVVSHLSWRFQMAPWYGVVRGFCNHNSI